MKNYQIGFQKEWLKINKVNNFDVYLLIYLKKFQN